MKSAGRARKGTSLLLWFDSWAEDGREVEDKQKVDWMRVIPFAVLHLSCLFVIAVGFSWPALIVAVGAYALRMFAITAFYHRYFSHRSFQTSRAMQFVFALLGATAIQRGPIWWASHHRAHHKLADKPEDVHSPARHGFLWSHIGWIVSRTNFKPRFELVQDLLRFPELRFLDRFDILIPVLSVFGFFGLGAGLAGLGVDTSGWQMVIWGFSISTVITHHITFSINSVAHRYGTRRYDTDDDSRNNWLLSLLTFGEGWHNNHHRYQASARQGFQWWELDISYYVLRLMAALGLVWRLTPVPPRVIAQGRNR
ncbi:MAG: stearoyl-CoA desaturase (delta-9 desaturase) [Planctomycetota bacterium]